METASKSTTPQNKFGLRPWVKLSMRRQRGFQDRFQFNLLIYIAVEYNLFLLNMCVTNVAKAFICNRSILSFHLAP